MRFPEVKIVVVVGPAELKGIKPPVVGVVVGVFPLPALLVAEFAGDGYVIVVPTVDPFELAEDVLYELEMLAVLALFGPALPSVPLAFVKLSATLDDERLGISRTVLALDLLLLGVASTNATFP